MNTSIRDVILFHLGFGFICALALVSPVAEGGNGYAILGLVIFYNLALPAFAYYRDYTNWIQIWRFVLPISVFQLLPDWFLADIVGTLVFVGNGAPKIGAVSLYMAGLWAIPLFLIVFVGDRFAMRYSERAALFAGAAIALAIFGLSEVFSHSLLGAWYAQDVWMMGPVALYVLPAEMLLGAAACYAYQAVGGAGLLQRVTAAFCVAVFYTGALAISLLASEMIRPTLIR